MSLDVTTTRDADGVQVALTGEFDISEAPKVERELRAIEQEDPARIVIDLRGLSFMDSSGLRIIVSAHQRLATEGRRLYLIPGPAPIQRIFTVTRLDERLDFMEAPAG
ncbi:MAG TPA: STAS domain-containing protein [Actinomycetota bacterium]